MKFCSPIYASKLLRFHPCLVPSVNLILISGYFHLYFFVIAPTSVLFKAEFSWELFSSDRGYDRKLQLVSLKGVLWQLHVEQHWEFSLEQADIKTPAWTGSLVMFPMESHPPFSSSAATPTALKRKLVHPERATAIVSNTASSLSVRNFNVRF